MNRYLFMVVLVVASLAPACGAPGGTNPPAATVPSAALRSVVPLEWSFRNANIPPGAWPTNSDEVIGFLIAGGHVQYFYRPPSPFRQVKNSLDGFWMSVQNRLGISNAAGRAAASRKTRVVTALQPEKGFWGTWAELLLRLAERWRFVSVTLLVIAILWGVHRRHLRRSAPPPPPDPARFKPSTDFSPWSKAPPTREAEPPMGTLPKGIRQRIA